MHVAPPPPCEIHPVNAYLTDLTPAALVRRDEEQTDHVELAAGFHEENQGVLLVVPVAAVGRHRAVDRDGAERRLVAAEVEHPQLGCSSVEVELALARRDGADDLLLDPVLFPIRVG